MVWVKASHVIKPCEDTPNVVMPSSDCDEIYSLTHNPIICFYRSGNPSIHTLKHSLSRALAIFYPFAGRLRWLDGGRTEIHCNAEGAVLLEAESDTRVDDYARRDFLPTPDPHRGLRQHPASTPASPTRPINALCLWRPWLRFRSLPGCCGRPKHLPLY